MARNFVNASNQYLQVNAAPVNARPITILGGFQMSTLASLRRLFAIWDASSTNNVIVIAFRGDLANQIQLIGYNGSDLAVAATSTAAQLDTWHTVAARMTAIDSWEVWLDGGGKGSDTTSVSISGLDTTAIGRWGGDTSQDHDGLAAEWAAYDIGLDDDEIAAYSAGEALPHEIRPNKLQGYWPVWGLHSPEIDLSGNNNNMTVFGATAANHAPVPPFLPAPGSAPLIEVAETIALDVGRDLWVSQSLVVNERETVAVGSGVDAWAGTALGVNEKTFVPIGVGRDLWAGTDVGVQADEAVAIGVGRDAWTGQPLTVQSAEEIGVGRDLWTSQPLVVNERETIAIGVVIDAWAGKALTVIGDEVVSIGIGRDLWQGTEVRTGGGSTYAGLHALTDVVPGNKEDLRDGRL